MKTIDGRPLWDFRALIACDGDGSDDGGGGPGMGGSGSGSGMGGEGTGSGAVGPGSGGQGGMGSSTTDVGTSGFGGNPDGTAIGTGMSAPGTAAASFAAPAPPPVAPPPPVATPPVAVATPKADVPAAKGAPAMGMMSTFGFGIPGMNAPPATTAAPATATPGMAGLTGGTTLGGGMGFGGLMGAVGAPMTSATNAVTSANPGTIGSSAMAASLGTGTLGAGAPTVGQQSGIGNFGGGPIGQEGYGFEDVYGFQDQGINVPGLAGQESLDQALGAGSAGGSPASNNATQSTFGSGIPGIQAVTQAEIAPPPPLMEATPATQAAAAAAEAANLQLALENAPPGAAATPAVFGANGVAPASPSLAAPGAPASVLGEGGAGAFENAGLGLMGAAAAPAAVTATAPASAPAAPAAVTATAPASAPSSATANVSPAAPAAPATPAAPAAPAAPVAAPAAPAAPVTAVPGGVAINLDQQPAKSLPGTATAINAIVGAIPGVGLINAASGALGLGSIGSLMAANPSDAPHSDDSPGDDGSSAGQADRTEAATSTPSENVKRLEEKYLGLPMWGNPEITRNRPTPYQRFVENRSQYGRSL